MRDWETGNVSAQVLHGQAGAGLCSQITGGLGHPQALYLVFALHAKQSDSQEGSLHQSLGKTLLPSQRRSLQELWSADVKFKPFPEGPSY